MYPIRSLSMLRMLKPFLPRPYSTTVSAYVVEELHARTLVRVSGTDVTDFLQGLITNDIHHLDNGNGSMYTHFLNTRGRVLFDTIIYRIPEKNALLIECDRHVESQLLKHLQLYRIRRKVEIKSVGDQFTLHTVFNPSLVHDCSEQNAKLDANQLAGLIVPCDTLKDTLPEGSAFCKTFQDLLIYRDPRLIELGMRVIGPTRCATGSAQMQLARIIHIDADSRIGYRWFRYRLGVGEGIGDLPSGNCFPLESNCDYLHGISFHKGCYVGQELTARTHHTGVVRKRLMPLEFVTVPTQLPSEEALVQRAHNNANFGKLRGVEGGVGLALLRVTEALGAREIEVGDGVARASKPSWWPVEAAKERQTLRKS